MTNVLVMFRRVITALFVGILAWWKGSPLVHGADVLYAVGFGAIMLIFLFVLYGLLQRQTVSKISPYLFLIPIFTFAFSLGLGTQRLAKTSTNEVVGNGLDLGAMVWSEWRARSDARKHPLTAHLEVGRRADVVAR